jgi:hypothetical protein
VTRRTRLDHIRTLDPVADHFEIVHLDTCYEFPFDMTRADEFALFRTFAVPSIGALLDHTGEFNARTQKRYDDTLLILSEIVEHGYDSERGRAAIARMNALHGRFKISNDDFLYVLSCFVFEPIRWMARYAWRPMDPIEAEATFHYWRAIGERMGIRDIPASMAEFERFNVAYEARRFSFIPANGRVAGSTTDMFVGWVLPRGLVRLGRPVVHALLEDNLLDALGLPHPPPAMRRAVRAGLRARSAIVRRLPERKSPHLRTQGRIRSYPGGYRIDALGPDPL